MLSIFDGILRCQPHWFIESHNLGPPIPIPAAKSVLRSSNDRSTGFFSGIFGYACAVACDEEPADCFQQPPAAFSQPSSFAALP